jgi:hypothetical protein
LVLTLALAQVDINADTSVALTNLCDSVLADLANGNSRLERLWWFLAEQINAH